MPPPDLPDLPDLPDFWRGLRAAQVQRIVGFATGEELARLGACRVARTRAFCRLEAARRARALASMAQSARVFAGLVTPIGGNKGMAATSQYVFPTRGGRGGGGGGSTGEDRAHCPGLDEGVLARTAGAVVTKAEVGERRVTFPRDEMAEFLTVLNAVCQSSLSVFGNGGDGAAAAASDGDDADWQSCVVAVVGYAYWRVIAMARSSSSSSNAAAAAGGKYDEVPANMTVHRQAHAAAFWAAEMIAGSWSKCVERLQRVFVDAEEKDLYLGDGGSTSDAAAAANRPRPRTWSFADVRPFLEHRRLVCSRTVLAKLSKAQEGWRQHPLSVEDTVQGLLDRATHDALPWYDVGQVICNDVWVALFLHFDRLIPPPMFFHENSRTIFAENLVVATANSLAGQVEAEGKDEAVPAGVGEKKYVTGAAASSKQRTPESTPDDGGAAAPAPPMSPRSISRIKQLDALHASVADRAAQVDDIERQVEVEAAAPGQYGGVAGALGQDLVRARAVVSKYRLAQHANGLAQAYGNLEKLQFTKVDAIITGDLTSGRADAKQKRKSLTKAISVLMARVVASREQVMALEKK